MGSLHRFELHMLCDYDDFRASRSVLSFPPGLLESADYANASALGEILVAVLGDPSPGLDLEKGDLFKTLALLFVVAIDCNGKGAESSPSFGDRALGVFSEIAFYDDRIKIVHLLLLLTGVTYFSSEEETGDEVVFFGPRERKGKI
jgi:hypothetical protein